MREAIKTAPANMETKETLKQLKLSYFTHRQIGASEAVYRIIQGMKLKDSNITCIFLPTGFPENRSVFLRKVSDSMVNKSMIKIVMKKMR